MEFRFEVKDERPDNPEVVLIEYLRNSSTHPWPYRERVITALKAFWLPLALEENAASADVLQRHTLAALNCLKNQQSYLEGLLRSRRLIADDMFNISTPKLTNLQSELQSWQGNSGAIELNTPSNRAAKYSITYDGDD